MSGKPRSRSRRFRSARAVAVAVTVVTLMALFLVVVTPGKHDTVSAAIDDPVIATVGDIACAARQGARAEQLPAGRHRRCPEQHQSQRRAAAGRHPVRRRHVVGVRQLLRQGEVGHQQRRRRLQERQPADAGEPRVPHRRSHRLLRVLRQQRRRRVEGVLLLRHRGAEQRVPLARDRAQQRVQPGRWVRCRLSSRAVAEERSGGQPERLHHRLLPPPPVLIEQHHARLDRVHPVLERPLPGRRRRRAQRARPHLRAFRSADVLRCRRSDAGDSPSSSSATAARASPRWAPASPTRWFATTPASAP